MSSCKAFERGYLKKKNAAVQNGLKLLSRYHNHSRSNIWSTTGLRFFRWREYKLRLSKLKKRIGKYLDNPPYDIGLTSRFDLKNSVELENAKQELLRIFKNHNSEQHVDEVVFKLPNLYGIDVKIQPKGRTKTVQLNEHTNETEELREVSSFTVTTSSTVPYRNSRQQIEDLQQKMNYIDAEMSKNFDLFCAASTLYVEIERLENFMYILDSLQTDRIEGTIKGSQIRFAYYGKRIAVDDTIGATAISWLKDAITYLG